MPTDATEAQSNASRAGVSTTLSVAMIVSPLTVVEGGPGAANTRFRRFTGLSPILWKAIAWIATASCRASRPQGHDVGTRAQRVQVVGPRLHHLLALGHVLRAVVGGADLVALGVCQLALDQIGRASCRERGCQYV